MSSRDHLHIALSEVGTCNAVAARLKNNPQRLSQELRTHLENALDALDDFDAEERRPRGDAA